MAQVGSDRSSRAKICLLITRMVHGGAQRVLWSLYDGLDRSRFEPIIVSGTETGAEGLLPECEARRAEIIWEPHLVRRVNPFRDALALVSLVKLLRRERVSLVHTHTSKAGILGRAAARLSGTPAVVHTPHGHIYTPGSNIRGVRQGLVTSTLLASERLARRWTHCLTTISEAERQDSIRLGICSPERSKTIWNGIPSDFASADKADRAAVRAELNIPAEAPVMISVGRLDSVKGHIYLVGAAPKVLEAIPEARFILVGSGSEESALRRRSAELNLEGHLLFLGRRSDVARLLAAADGFVMPSLYEGFGLAALEAMAAGLPVVATSAGGVPELVLDGDTGILVSPGSADELAAAIARILKDQEMRRRMGTAGRERFEEFFTVDRMIHAFEDVYEECLGGRLRGG